MPCARRGARHHSLRAAAANGDAKYEDVEDGPKVIMVEDEDEEPKKKACCVVM